MRGDPRRPALVGSDPGAFWVPSGPCTQCETVPSTGAGSVTSVFVKICGITRPANAIAAVDVGADAIGLNFVPTSRRFVDLELARAILAVVPEHLSVLALTESITLVADTHVPRSVLDDAATVFEGDELTRLVYAIIEINAWNRLAITVGAPELGTTRPRSPSRQPTHG